jgi:hypothetical protein
MSVRNVLHWPAKASRARTDDYKVTHINLNIPKLVWRKVLCHRRAIAVVASPAIRKRVIRKQIHAFSPFPEEKLFDSGHGSGREGSNRAMRSIDDDDANRIELQVFGSLCPKSQAMNVCFAPLSMRSKPSGRRAGSYSGKFEPPVAS